MDLILIAKNEDFGNLLQFHLKPIGFHIVQYTDPVEVISHLEQIAPEMVLFHAGDFPRHWKPLLRLVRVRGTKEEIVFVIIKGEDFPVEEVAKASHLGANGLINADVTGKQECKELADIVKNAAALFDGIDNAPEVVLY